MRSKHTTDDIASPIHSMISKYGQPPLAGTSLGELSRLDATPDIVLAMTMDAMVKSRPISHNITRRTISKLIEEDYHNINTLANSAWDERTDVLREGGYNRYSEQCSTNLGGLETL